MDQQAGPPSLRAVHELDGKAGTVTEARVLTRAFLDACVPNLGPRACEDALLLVSELVSNAVRHAQGPCTHTLTHRGAGLGIALSDTSEAFPEPRTPDLLTGAGGFGWHLLERLSQQLEVRRHPGGKTVSLTLRQDTDR
jgi:anti-sigma regulatory factor (Ser/Thr protein kinase)